MCGLNAILTEKNSSVPFHMLEKMHAQIPHRGPDGEGFLSWDPNRSIQITHCVSQLAPGRLLFSHRRLAIQDTLSRSSQPMANADKTLFIILNGEIYNFIELRENLQNIGHSFITSSDTEVLLKAYEAWGPSMLTKLVGMFAFLILDLRKSVLFVARDFFGIKPLYYSKKIQGIYFASEINSLICLDSISKKVHLKSLYDYLRFGLTDHSSDTLFQDIKQFPAAHYAILDLNNPFFNPIRYWEPRLTESDYTQEQAAQKLQTLFLKNIELHLRSDVPVGAALSGGLDSSAIVMGMRAIGGNNLNIKTFSYCARNSNYNEEVWADQVIQASNAECYKIFLTPNTLKDDLETLINVQGEPFGSTSIYAQYKVFELARAQGIKVMLDGQGADELLGGYRPYLAKRLAKLIKDKRVDQVVQFITSAISLPDINIRRFFLQIGAQFIPSIFENILRKISGESLTPRWLNKGWFVEQGLSFNSFYGSKIDLKEALLESLTHTVLPALLRYEDRNSMHFSIESRVPFLTPELADFIYSLDEGLLISNQAETKFIFRQAVKGLVPEDILNRRDKIGFRTPEKAWVKTLYEYFEKSFNNKSAYQIPCLNHKETLMQFQKIKERNVELDFKYWRWLNILKWAETYNVEFDE